MRAPETLSGLFPASRVGRLTDAQSCQRGCVPANTWLSGWDPGRASPGGWEQTRKRRASSHPLQEGGGESSQDLRLKPQTLKLSFTPGWVMSPHPRGNREGAGRRADDLQRHRFPQLHGPRAIKGKLRTLPTHQRPRRLVARLSLSCCRRKPKKPEETERETDARDKPAAAPRCWGLGPGPWSAVMNVLGEI